MDVTSLERLFQGFLLAKEADGLKETTLKMYRWMYRSLVEHLSCDKLQDASTITPQDLQRWVLYLNDQKNYANATRDQRITKCKSFFKWCCGNGFLAEDPSTGLKRPKKNWQPDPLNEDELHMLLEESRKGRCGVRNYAIICFLVDSGVRNSELCDLKAEEVSLKTGQIKIREGKGSKPRTVIVGKRTKEALWRWMMQRPEGTAYLFCTENGRKFGRTILRRIVSIIGEKTGVRVYPHRLRHTFALQYLKLCGDPYSLQYLPGHEDMTTVREYVKIAAQDVRQMYRSPAGCTAMRLPRQLSNVTLCPSALPCAIISCL
jgi:integrase/recombinase XerD